jgi:hypothetical protein
VIRPCRTTCMLIHTREVRKKAHEWEAFLAQIRKMLLPPIDFASELLAMHANDPKRKKNPLSRSRTQITHINPFPALQKSYVHLICLSISHIHLCLPSDHPNKRQSSNKCHSARSCDRTRAASLSSTARAVIFDAVHLRGDFEDGARSGGAAVVVVY